MVGRQIPEGDVQATSEPMVFPQIARLELDDLLSQLIERAQDVLDTQGRLRSLVTATRAVSSDLSLPAVLRRIVESACELISARYGALGVIGPDDRLSEFIQVGMDADTVEAIGHLPEGRGILGALINDPRPLRLDGLQSDSRSIGFPSGHPPMHSFLGVPVRVREHVFGNIYLTDKTTGGPFTAEDEELLSALAGAAAVAIDNAQLYAASQRRQRWLQVSAETTTQLLGQAENPHGLLAQRAREGAEADLCLICLPAGEGSTKLRVVAADGAHASDIRGLLFPREGSVAGRVLDQERHVVVEYGGDFAPAFRERGVRLGTVIAVRFPGLPDADGVLAICRLEAGEPFADDVVEMVTLFAHQAAVALQLATAQRNVAQLQLLEERDRIGQDLHDHVIGRLFAAGMTVHGLTGRIDDPDVRARLVAHVDGLDETIAIIRRSVFGLQHPASDQ